MVVRPFHCYKCLREAVGHCRNDFLYFPKINDFTIRQNLIHKVVHNFLLPVIECR